MARNERFFLSLCKKVGKFFWYIIVTQICLELYEIAQDSDKKFPTSVEVWAFNKNSGKNEN